MERKRIMMQAEEGFVRGGHRKFKKILLFPSQIQHIHLVK